MLLVWSENRSELMGKEIIEAMHQAVTYLENDAPVFLKIGDVVFLDNNEKAWTILGSCVSVCLHSKIKNISAICHAQLPEMKRVNTSCFDNHLMPCKRCQTCSHENKYMDKALPFMIRFFEKQGVPVNSIEAIVIGGSASLNNFSMGVNIGKQNVAMAKKILAEYKIRIILEDTGGKGSKRVSIDNSTGYVFIDKIKLVSFSRKR